MKIGIGALMVSAAVALLAAAAAPSASQQSQPLPAGAGSVTAFAFDPANPNVVYTATEPGPGGSHDRVYKSTDGGAHWQRLFSGRGWFRAYTLAVDPNHPRTVYVGGGKCVYKTTNGGRTWHVFSRGLLPPPGINRGEGWVFWLAIDPGNTSVLYEYDYGGTLRKSVDGARTWKVVLSVAKRRSFAWSWLMAPHQPLALYASFRPVGPGGGKAGVYKSTDGGKAWRRLALPALLETNSGANILVPSAADPQRNTLYFSEWDGIYASTNAGRTWHSISSGLPHDQPVSALAAGGGTVIASLGTDGVYTSTNQGQTWTRTWPASGLAPGLGVDLVTVDPAHPASVIATAIYPANRPTGTHILRSTNSGRTWTVTG
jgi:photosystem II stability/assembly factor-like uncharacterized protein